MSYKSKLVPISYERDVYKTRTERRLPTYYDSSTPRRYTSYKDDFSYTDPCDGGITYNYDKETRRQSDEMRKTWDDTFHRVAPRADDWKLADTISKKLTPIDDLSSWLSSADDWKTEGKYNKHNTIKEDRFGTRKFFLEYDLSGFKPEEITIKISGNFLTVRAKHEERTPGVESSTKEYSREYLLPSEVKPELLTSKLSRTGKFTIEAPIISGSSKHTETSIPITYGY